MYKFNYIIPRCYFTLIFSIFIIFIGLDYGYFSYKTMYRIHLDRFEHPWSYNHSIMITHLNETNYQIKEPDMNSEVDKLLGFVDKGYLSDSPFSEDILTIYRKK
jgi:hypothetical protein